MLLGLGMLRAVDPHSCLAKRSMSPPLTVVGTTGDVVSDLSHYSLDCLAPCTSSRNLIADGERGESLLLLHALLPRVLCHALVDAGNAAGFLLRSLRRGAVKLSHLALALCDLIHCLALLFER